MQVRLKDIQAPKRWALNGGPFGSKLVQKDYRGNGVPVIRGCNLPLDRRFSSDEFVFVSSEKADDLLPNNAHAGDVIFTQRGTLGQVGVIPDGLPHERYVISQSQMKLSVDASRADANYVYYVFRAPSTVKQIHNCAFSSGVPHINLEILRDFEIDLPDLDTQRRIVSILSAYDDLIDNNTRRIKTLEEMAQMIYREWFVNFRFPGHENVKQMVNSEIGSIPQGWSVGSLDSLMDFQGGAQPPKAEWSEEPLNGYVRMIQIRDYQSDNHFGYVVDSGQLRKCSEKDIMIARYGASVGRICWGLKGAYNVALVRVIPAESYFQEFLRSVLASESVQSLLIGMSGRTAQAGFNKSILPAIRIPIPPDKRIFEKYESIAGSIRSMQLKLSQATKNLRFTRDLLLPKLISGESSVEAAEREAAAHGA